MKVWVMQGIHEGDMFASTHLTEKGAALAALADVLVFLGVEDEETALSAMNMRVRIGESEVNEAPEWDFEKMNDMKRDELWKIFGAWSEFTWDNDCGYQIDVNKTVIAA